MEKNLNMALYTPPNSHNIPIDPNNMKSKNKNEKNMDIKKEEEKEKM